jgi:anti-sigma factor RsiW
VDGGAVVTEPTPPGLRITCQELVELITDYLEGALDESTVTELEAHLELCPHCTVYLEQLRATIAALGHLPVDSLSEETTSGLMTVFRDFTAPRRPQP